MHNLNQKKKQILSIHCRKIEEISMHEKIEREIEMQRRKKRKSKAIKGKKEFEFTNFCSEQCDEIFKMILDKFTEFLLMQKDIPKPLIMAPTSLTLYQNVQDVLMKLIDPITAAEFVMKETPVNLAIAADQAKEIAETKEIVDSLSYFITEFIQNSLVEAI